MSAQHIIDEAPLGAIIRFSDGTPRPPERFRRKLADWETRNDKGRLIRKEPAFDRGDYHYPGGFGLHLGDYGANGVVVIKFTRHFQATTPLNFEVVERPVAGSVRILVPSGDTEELEHLAPDMAAAEAWAASHGFAKARLEPVEAENGECAA